MAQTDTIRPKHPPTRSNFPQSRPSIQSDDRAYDREREKPRRIANLAAFATNVLRPKDLPTVRYIAQVDLEAWMVRRSKVGTTSNMFVVLEGTILSVFKNRSGPRRYEVNVRSEDVSVNIERIELHIYVQSNPPGKKRLLRLHISSVDVAYQWKHALDNAVVSEITDYYTFGEILGTGAYGEVVEATDVRTAEKRAVKIIKRGNSMKTQEHLESEIRVMRSISHPNIVKSYQIFDLKRTIYIVMEYVRGGDLFDFVSQHDCLTETQSSQTLHSILQAVEFLHRNGIVHRDLKPENILCANDTWPLQVKVSDFGFASFIDPCSGNSTMGSPVGTVYFMAPEIISYKGYGPAVDSWACGVILYTILTGRLPFPGKNTREYFNNVLKGTPSFPGFLWKGISEDAISLVKGLLNPDPNKRLTSLGALQHRWIARPVDSTNEIRRDRTNLHSKRRRLFKARKAIIAVAMATKFKATIPQVVDAVGDGTRKVVDGIEQGVKKTADGVKKVGDGLGEGTKKVAEEIGEGTKKVATGIADGTKRVAGGIGTGVKKTVDGVEIGAKKVGEGVKKTADGIETGLKKTADGIETGFKKTADGIGEGLKKTADGLENGFKKTADGIGEGLKKTGEGIKNVSIQAVERVKVDRNRESTASGGSRNEGSYSESPRELGRKRLLFRRRGHESRSSAISGSELARQAEVPSPQVPTSIPILPAQYVPAQLPESGSASDPEQMSEDVKHSSTEYYSAVEDHSEAEEGWNRQETEGTNLNLKAEDGDSDVTPPQEVYETDIEMRERPRPTFAVIPVQTLRETSSIAKKFSNISFSSSGTPTCRPVLAPLDGFPLGLSDNNTGDAMDCEEEEGDILTRAAALLLAASDTSGQRESGE